MLKSVTLLVFLTFFAFGDSKSYVKKYYPNGKIREEGWMIKDKKSDYWFYYYENGFKKEEGHYRNDQKINWWIYYDIKKNLMKKCEYKYDILNGLYLIYKNNKIVLIEKYDMGQKIKSWSTLSEFKKDNN
jgi:antitoxin component YwqK of YwqJK toxin-antitoxin module